jgi:hypothetical protein
VRRHRRQRGGGGEAIVYTFTNYAGFYSMFWFLANAYIYAKEQSIPFFIEHDNWQYTYEKGWHDYFTSLNDWDEAKSSEYSSVRRMKHTQLPGVPQKYSVQRYVDAIKEIFTPTAELQKIADDFRTQLGGDYTSLYIRRGDKVAEKTREMSLLSIDDILQKTQIQDDGRTIFLMTDDYTTVEELKAKRPSCKVFTMCKESLRGSDIYKQRAMNRDERKAHATELLASSIVFKGGKTSWSDERSNVGRFLFLYAYPDSRMYPTQQDLPPDREIIPSNTDWAGTRL